VTSIARNLEQVWPQLRSQNPGRTDSLEEVTIKGLRGIHDLRVPLPFPVTVLAGPNGCGKSTVLFALACAYRVPGAGPRMFTPASLFPDFRPNKPAAADDLADAYRDAEITFSYVAGNVRQQMRWSRGAKKWNRSYFGRKRGSQPVRPIYLRTLSNLSNPSEIRSVLQMAQRSFKPELLDASNIAFAQRILSYRYAKLSLFTSGLRNILFAERERLDPRPEAVRYSEFHMSAGERALLRLSLNISKLDNALVLIDEIEAGLHPFVQQLLMLELQRLALRNQLQVVVTTHSPIVLDTVPPEARVFLERSTDNVVRREAYRDIIQKALYGRSQNMLSVLCEDEEAEALVRGFLDHLGPRIDFLQNDIEIGRDTGKDEYLAHVETLARFRKLADVLFVLDGDGRAVLPQIEARAQQLGQAVRIISLPGTESPETWIWRILGERAELHGPALGLAPAQLRGKLAEIDNLYASAADKPSSIAKNKLSTLADSLARSTPSIVRDAARTEAAQGAGEAHDVVNLFQDAINDWRAMRLLR